MIPEDLDPDLLRDKVEIIVGESGNIEMNVGMQKFPMQTIGVWDFSDKDDLFEISDTRFIPKDPENNPELRTEKFYVLAAARHHEMSWGVEDENPGNYFIKWLIEGIGKRGNSPADTSPKNRVFTLEELFSYIKRYNTYAFFYEGKTYNQHVQRYPKSSRYPILMLP